MTRKGLALAAVVACLGAERVLTQGMPPADTLVWVRYDVQMADGTAVPPGSGVLMPYRETMLFLRLDGPNPIPLPPGTMPVFIRSAPGYYVESARLGGVDVLRAPVTLTLGEEPGELHVVYTRTEPADAPKATIAGVVPDRQGVEVEIMPATTPPGIPEPMYRIVDEGGRFRVEGLAPGIYEISLPPAARVARVVAPAGETEIRIDTPPGNLFGGGVVVMNEAGERVFTWQTRPPVLLFQRAGEQVRVPITPGGFWGALMPGEYSVTVEGLEDGLALQALRAGSVSLLDRPLLVPIGRSPESIYVELRKE